MKTKNKFLILFILIISVFVQTGCLKMDTLENINVYTTVYPLEYITKSLYGEHSTVKSIYPNGVNTNNYKLTNNQIKDYSKSDMYIFDGLTYEKEYVTSMFKYNKDLMIIDASQSIEYTYYVEELWLDPSNFLMLASNIKNGLNEYISNHYLKTEIDENYDTLKINISKIDANLKLMSESVDNPTIVVDSNMFKFLEKYGFTVISLEESDTLTDKIISDVTNLIKSNQISYIYTINKENINDTIKKLINTTNVQLLELNTLSNLTDQERSNNEDYITLLNNNIDLIKNELYE